MVHEGLTHQFHDVMQQWRRDVGAGTHVFLGRSTEKKLRFFEKFRRVDLDFVFFLAASSDLQRMCEVFGNQRCYLRRPLQLPHLPQSVWQPPPLHGQQLQGPHQTGRSSAGLLQLT